MSSPNTDDSQILDSSTVEDTAAVPAALIETLPAEIFGNVVAELPLLSRANLARTSKYLATHMTIYKHLDFKAKTCDTDDALMQRLGPRTDVICQDLDFLIYSELSANSSKELDASGSHVMQVTQTGGYVACTNCGWRDSAPRGCRERLRARHMRLEMARLGVIYSQGVRILTKSASRKLISDARDVEAENQRVLAPLTIKYRNYIKLSWNFLRTNQMLHLWEQQEAAGQRISKRFKSSLSQWGV